MIEIIWDKPFLRILRKWKKKQPELISQLEAKLILFSENPFHPSLKTHFILVSSNNSISVIFQLLLIGEIVKIASY